MKQRYNTNNLLSMPAYVRLVICAVSFVGSTAYAQLATAPVFPTMSDCRELNSSLTASVDRLHEALRQCTVSAQQAREPIGNNSFSACGKSTWSLHASCKSKKAELVCALAHKDQEVRLCNSRAAIAEKSRAVANREAGRSATRAIAGTAGVGAYDSFNSWKTRLSSARLGWQNVKSLTDRQATYQKRNSALTGIINMVSSNSKAHSLSKKLTRQSLNHSNLISNSAVSELERAFKRFEAELGLKGRNNKKFQTNFARTQLPNDEEPDKDGVESITELKRSFNELEEVINENFDESMDKNRNVMEQAAAKRNAEQYEGRLKQERRAKTQKRDSFVTSKNIDVEGGCDYLGERIMLRDIAQRKGTWTPKHEARFQRDLAYYGPRC